MRTKEPTAVCCGMVSRSIGSTPPTTLSRSAGPSGANSALHRRTSCACQRGPVELTCNDSASPGATDRGVDISHDAWELRRALLARVAPRERFAGRHNTGRDDTGRGDTGRGDTGRDHAVVREPAQKHRMFRRGS